MLSHVRTGESNSYLDVAYTYISTGPAAKGGKPGALSSFGTATYKELVICVFTWRGRQVNSLAALRLSEKSNFVNFFR